MEPTVDTTPSDLLLEAPVESIASATDTLIDDELLVEEISIDGMCGVY